MFKVYVTKHKLYTYYYVQFTTVGPARRRMRNKCAKTVYGAHTVERSNKWHGRSHFIMLRPWYVCAKYLHHTRSWPRTTSKLKIRARGRGSCSRKRNILEYTFLMSQIILIVIRSRGGVYIPFFCMILCTLYR